MSIDYMLVCVDCQEQVLLGNVITASYTNVERETFAFSCLSDFPSNDGKWRASQESIEVLQHFFMIHLTHELRIVPDNFPGVEGPFPMDDNDIDPNYDRLKFLNRKINRPNPIEALNCASIKLLNKLES